MNGKSLKKCIFSIAIVLCDMNMQLTSNPLNSKGQGHLVTFAKGSLVGKYFLPETAWPMCIVNIIIYCTVTYVYKREVDSQRK